MKTNRRKFIKGIIATGSVLTAIPVLLPGQSSQLSEIPPPDFSSKNKEKRRQWVMVVDLDRCDGCKACTEACIARHNVPPAWSEPNHEGYQEWIKVVKVESNPIAGEYFMPMPCMNCQNAPCVKVCPVGATYYNETSIVLVDNTRCIGCRMCMAACPYQRRYFNWGEPPHSEQERFITYRPDYPAPHRKGTVEKCIFCAHLVQWDGLPYCVQACTDAGMKALYFGDAAEDAVSNGDDVVRLSKLLAERGAFRLKEELGTEPMVYFLPKRGGD